MNNELYCQQCGNRYQQCLVKFIKSQEIYCNCNQQGQQQSCCYIHLNQRKEDDNQIELIQPSQQNIQRDVLCNYCGQRDVFQLSFLKNNNNNSDLPFYICKNCLEENFTDYLEQYDNVINNSKGQINKWLVWNQQFQENDDNLVVNEQNIQYNEANERKRNQERYNQISQILSKEEIENRLQVLPVIPDNLNCKNSEVMNVNGQTYLLNCFKQYIENGEVTYNIQTGEFQVQSQKIYEILQKQSGKRFKFYNECYKIAQLQLQIEKYQNSLNKESLRSVDFDLRVNEQNREIVVFLSNRGNPCCVCGKQVQQFDQIYLSISDQNNDKVLQIELCVRDIYPDYIVCICKNVENQYQDLIEDLMNQKYNNIFNQLEIDQYAQFTSAPSKKFITRDYRNYQIFQPQIKIFGQLELLQSDDWLKKIKKGLDCAKCMEQCKILQNDNEQNQYLFTQEQLIQRRTLIKKLLYDDQQNNFDNIEITEQQFQQIVSQIGYTPSQQQKQIIQQALNQHITCIDGVPSSGKTLIAATLAGLLSQKDKVIIQVRSNKCADQICYLLHKVFKPGELIRVYSHTQQQIINQQTQKDLYYEKIINYTLQQLIIDQVKYQDEQEGIELEFYFKDIIRNENRKQQKEKYQKIINQNTQNLLYNAKVIITTVLTTYDDRLINQYFGTVIVDDAHNLNIGETITCASKAINSLILIGDSQQSQNINRKSGLNQTKYLNSFMQRLNNRQDNQYVKLNVSYKQDKNIVRLLNSNLYHHKIIDSRLYDGIIVNSLVNRDQRLRSSLIMLNKKSVISYEKRSQSYYSLDEAQTVRKVVSILTTMDVDEKDITVVTNQLQHENKIKNSLIQYEGVNICSTNSLSGLSTKILIYSCCASDSIQKINQDQNGKEVLCQDTNDIQFFTKKNSKTTLKTLFSRAKQQLIVICDTEFTSQCQYFEQIIKYFQQYGMLKNADDL